MRNNFLSLSFGLLAILMVQVFVLNHVQLGGYLNPYVYPFVLLLFPVRTDRAFYLILAFLTGLFVDVFENSGGIHAAATTLTAYLRPRFLRLISTQGGNEFETLTIREIGLNKMLTFAGLVILQHHFTLFFLESFSFREFGQLLLRTLLSSLTSFTLFFLWELVFFGGSKRNR